MTTDHRFQSLLACLALAACAADLEENPELVAGEATTGGACGTGTAVARLTTPSGTNADFCLFPDDLIGVRETGPLDARPYVETLPGGLCADEIHARLAPGEPVPQALIDACSDRTTALTLGRDEPEPDGIDADGDLNDRPVPLAHYCGAGGDVEFDQERCSTMQEAANHDGWWDSVWWCSSSSATSMQRTASSQIGHNVNKLGAVVASCSGSTSVQLKAKVGGSWNTYVSDTVSGNYWDSWSLWSYYDHDMRVNASSAAGWFRSAGHFGDYQWP